MDFMGIGPMELLVILIIALIIFGPNRLPEIAAQLGKFMNNMRKAGFELSRELNRELEQSKKDVATATSEIKTVTKTSLAVLEEEEAEKEKQPVAAVAAETKTDTPETPATPAHPSL